MRPKWLACALVLSAVAVAGPAPAADGLVCIPPGRISAKGALPVGAGSCTGVRPGAYVETPIGSCTMNFLFTGSDKNRYVGTAGHCFVGEGLMPEDVGEKTWKWPKGPIAKDGQGRVIGRAVYAVLKDPKDFALIRLLPGTPTTAAMCHFGGPTSASAPAQAPELLHYFGNGLAIGDILPARTAVATNVSSPDHIYAQGLVLVGDSGGGVIDDTGRAVGVLVTTGVHTSGLADPGTIGITRLQPQLARAAKVLRIRLTLRTAPLA